jgi:hypothetical protein
MSDRERRPYVSGATLQSASGLALLDREQLHALVAPFGVQLVPLEEAPPDKHPLWIEFWRVQGGRTETAGWNQQAMLAAVGALGGAPLGTLVGAARGAVQGAAAGAAAGMRLGPLGWGYGMTVGWLLGAGAGAARGSAWGGARGVELGRRWSDGSAATWGTYDEVLIAVPNAVRAGGNDRRYMFVLGMFSNNPVSIWGDRAMGCGYRKREARMVRLHSDAQDVYTSDPEPVLTMRSIPPAPSQWRSPESCPELAVCRALMSQPLLGVNQGGGFAVTFLDRFLDRPATRVSPLRAEIVIGDRVGPTMPHGRLALVPATSSGSWGSFRATDLEVKLSYPYHPASRSMDLR